MFKSFKPFDSRMTRGTVKCEVLLSNIRQGRGNSCASSPAGRAVRRHGACRSNLAYEKLDQVMSAIVMWPRDFKDAAAKQPSPVKNLSRWSNIDG